MKGILLIPAVLVAAIVYAVVDADSGVRTLWQLHASVAAARGRVAAIELENAALRREAGALETDAFAIEAAIREDLALVRPGERVVRLTGPEDSNPRFP